MHCVSKSKLIARQKAELTIELGRVGLFAKRFTASLRGFDLYTESLEAGASRNHFKLSAHASGSAHHTVGRLRSPENIGQALSGLTAPLAINRHSLAGHEGGLTWRSQRTVDAAERRTLTVDLRTHPGPWVVVLALPSHQAHKLEELLQPKQYPGTLVGYVVSDWTEPHIVLAVYDLLPDALATMRAKLRDLGEADETVMTVGPALPDIAHWTGRPAPTPRSTTAAKWRRIL